MYRRENGLSRIIESNNDFIKKPIETKLDIISIILCMYI